MGFLDKAKGMLGGAKDKVDDLADTHGDKMKDGVAKAGDVIDDKTGGKFADKVEMAEEKATDAIDKLQDKK